MTVTYIDKQELMTPKNNHETIVNHWWWEKDGQILDWIQGRRRIMQCNPNENVMRYMVNSKVNLYLGHVPVLIPVAYYPIQND